MSNPLGNPKSLQEAIEQAATYINKLSDEAGISHCITVADKMVVEQFVRDFLSQVFGAAMLQAHTKQCGQEMDQLWKKIIGS